MINSIFFNRYIKKVEFIIIIIHYLIISRPKTTMEVAEMLYSDDYLIDRIVGKLSQSKTRFVIRPPKSERKNKKTYVTNFTECCKSANRDAEFVKTFYENTLGVSSSISGDGTLIINKMYNEKEVIDVFATFLKEYVICSQCGSGNTEMIRDNRLPFLMCNACKSKKSKSK